MNARVTSVLDLEARYPYMFKGPHIGLNHFTGWFPTFVQLCVAIDAVLGPDKRGFHWVQIKEKFGGARFNHAMDLRLAPVGEYFDVERDFEPDTLVAFICALIDEAESITAKRCIRCGKPAKAMDLDGYVWTLCREHRPPAGMQRAQIKAHLKEIREGLRAS